MAGPAEGDALALVITGRDIWDKLLHIEAEVTGLPKRVDDHEVRLRAVEVRKSVSPLQLWTVTASAAGLITATLSLILRFA